MSLTVLYACCAGLDVHKKTVVACVLHSAATGKASRQVRPFATTTVGLQALADWLISQGVTHVAMESTGVYWRPVYNLLEGRCEVILVNAAHMKAVPGHKTDIKDSEWLADLLRHGLLKASFIPPKPIRELRDLVRYRKRLVQQRTQTVNRHLRAVLAECVWVISHTKDNYLSAQYHRLARRIGKKRAVVAVSHSLLVIIYHLLSTKQDYHDLGAHFEEMSAIIFPCFAAK